jgi:biopolymer transport protein ExbD
MAKSSKASQEVDMDMTPMIDCVFLLMIFFVLVIDLSQKDLEDQDGRMVYRKNTYYDPIVDGETEQVAKDKLRTLLIEWKEEIVTDKKDEVIGGRKVTVVDDPVLVRADKWTEWHWVGLFMTACSQPEAAFWKLELALSEEDKEQKQRPDAFR